MCFFAINSKKESEWKCYKRHLALEIQWKKSSSLSCFPLHWENPEIRVFYQNCDLAVTGYGGTLPYCFLDGIFYGSHKIRVKKRQQMLFASGLKCSCGMGGIGNTYHLARTKPCIFGWDLELILWWVLEFW